ncbi:hypothetical protein N2W54_000275 [Lotmaria passim]
MPAIDTPFVMELHPGEKLKLAQTQAAEVETSAATAAGTSAFAKNDFQAWVSSISFVEEVDAETDAISGVAAKPAHGHRHSVIRVSLLAHLRPQAGDGKNGRKRDREGAATASPSVVMKTVTLASCNFSAGASANAVEPPASSAAMTRLGGSTVFRAPLAFTSRGPIQNLSVVAEDMATTAGSSGSSGSVKRYHGARRFAVRMQGLQQTMLTDEQVLLLAKQ